VGLDGFALLCFALGFVGEGVRARVVMPMAVYGYIVFPFLFILCFTLQRIIFCLFILLSFMLFCAIGVQYTRFPLTREREETSG